MNENPILNEIDGALSKIVTSLDPEILSYSKEYFEKNLLYIYGKEKLEVIAVIDANAVISDAISRVRRHKSYLLDLLNSQSPFLKICSPTWLRTEIDEKIPEVAGQKGMDEKELKEAAYAILEKIQIIDSDNGMAYSMAFNVVGHRDIKDVPYVTLYFSIKAHGVLTKDKHITQSLEIKTWEKSGTLGKIVTLFGGGSFSFLVLGKTLPLAFRLLSEMLTGLLKIIWVTIQTVGTALIGLVETGVEALSELPTWALALIGVVVVVALIYEKSRRVITDVVQSIMSRIIAVLNWIYQAIKGILSVVAPLVEIPLQILAVLFLKVDETITTYEELNSPLRNAEKPASI